MKNKKLIIFIVLLLILLQGCRRKVITKYEKKDDISNYIIEIESCLNRFSNYLNKEFKMENINLDKNNIETYFDDKKFKLGYESIFQALLKSGMKVKISYKRENYLKINSIKLKREKIQYNEFDDFLEGRLKYDNDLLFYQKNEEVFKLFIYKHFKEQGKIKYKPNSQEYIKYIDYRMEVYNSMDYIDKIKYIRELKKTLINDKEVLNNIDYDKTKEIINYKIDFFLLYNKKNISKIWKYRELIRRDL